MPRYDYQCDECNLVFEVRHGFNETATVCPNGHTNIHKLITTSPRMLLGMAAPASKNASKEELKRKWDEETPKLRQKLVDKLGEEAVRKSAPSLNMNND